MSPLSNNIPGILLREELEMSGVGWSVGRVVCRVQGGGSGHCSVTVLGTVWHCLALSLHPRLP